MCKTVKFKYIAPAYKLCENNKHLCAQLNNTQQYILVNTESLTPFILLNQRTHQLNGKKLHNIFGFINKISNSFQINKYTV